MLPAHRALIPGIACMFVVVVGHISMQRASATLLVYEAFNYTPHSGVGNLTPNNGNDANSFGWSGAWFTAFGGNAFVESGNLANPGVPSGAGTNFIGNGLAGERRNGRNLASGFSDSTPQTIQVAFALLSGFNDGGFTVPFSALRLQNGGALADITLGIGEFSNFIGIVGPSGPVVSTGVADSANGGLLWLVTTIQYVAGANNDIATLRVFNSVGTPLGSSAMISGFDLPFVRVDTQLERHALDQIMISDVPVPEPASGYVALIGLVGLGLLAMRRHKNLA